MYEQKKSREGKYRKIPNIDLTVCTGEAVIAYNYMQRYSDLYFKKDYKKLPSVCQCDIKYKFVDFVIKSIKSSYSDFSRYNLDYIVACLWSGMDEYINAGAPILWDYKQVGEIFKSKYIK